MLLRLPQLQGEMPGSPGQAGSQVSGVLGREAGGHGQGPRAGMWESCDYCGMAMGRRGFGQGSH